jgi:hypothetical protein
MVVTLPSLVRQLLKTLLVLERILSKRMVAVLVGLLW